MPYDEDLADRVRSVLADTDGVREQRMFGGLAFLINDTMAVAAGSGGGLMVRLDPDDAADLLGGPGVEPFVMRGRAMKGWLNIDPSATATDAELGDWVERGVAFARTLPRRRRSGDT